MTMLMLVSLGNLDKWSKNARVWSEFGGARRPPATTMPAVSDTCCIGRTAADVVAVAGAGCVREVDKMVMIAIL